LNSIVVHYQELALKGKNRPWFLGRLVRNLRRALSDLDVRTVRALMGRVEVVLGPGAVPAEVSERISRVFGIANFSYANSTPLDYARSDDGRSERTGPTGDLDVIAKAILTDLGDRTCTSFRVSARRADKRFPMTSPQIEREVGGRIKEARGSPIRRSTSSARSVGREACPRGRPAAWCVCCRAGSILPSPLTA
jgi:thiamine biosynthesis protein ThiI